MAEFPIVHLEMVTTDIEKTKKFYADTFGWQVHTAPEFNYTMFQPQVGPGGAFITPSEEPVSYKAGEVLVYIGTDDIDATLAKIEANGGHTLVPKLDMGPNGWMAIFVDAAGNRMALYTSPHHTS